MDRLHLDDVTLCAADTANHALAARALDECLRHCAFADAVLFSDRAVPGAFRTEIIAPFASRGAYSEFMLKRLHALVRTPWVLVVQWDGYVVAPSAWRPEFRSYDYIGARWGWHSDGMNVGNGGFSLRSRKLLRTLADPRFAASPEVGEDVLICRVYRPILAASYGVRFAPDAVADRFSYERQLPEAPTFGFHGLFNFWRHVGDGEMAGLAGELVPYLLRTREFAELAGQYYAFRKFIPFRALYARMRKELGADEARRVLEEHLRDAGFVAAMARAGEALLVEGPQPERVSPPAS